MLKIKKFRFIIYMYENTEIYIAARGAVGAVSGAANPTRR